MIESPALSLAIVQQLLAVPFPGGIGASTPVHVSAGIVALTWISLGLLISVLVIGFVVAYREGR